MEISSGKICSGYFNDKSLVLKDQKKLWEKLIAHIFARSKDQVGCVPRKVK